MHSLTFKRMTSISEYFIPLINTGISLKIFEYEETVFARNYKQELKQFNNKILLEDYDHDTDCIRSVYSEQPHDGTERVSALIEPQIHQFFEETKEHRDRKQPIFVVTSINWLKEFCDSKKY